MTLIDEAEPLLNSWEVARLFGVDRKVPVRWVRRGLLPAIKTPGGTLRFRASDVYAAIDKSAETPARADRGGRPGPD